MADPVEITILYDDPLFEQAMNEPAGAFPALADAMTPIMSAYEDRASVYAPESEANQPGRFSLVTQKPMGYYERGRGWWYPLLTHRTIDLTKEVPLLRLNPKAPHTAGMKTLMAAGIPQVAGYRLIENSEQMHDKWSFDVEVVADEIIGHMVNTASYSALVQGMEQTRLHQARDWQTFIDVWESDAMQEIVYQETDKAISTYFHLA